MGPVCPGYSHVRGGSALVCPQGLSKSVGGARPLLRFSSQDRVSGTISPAPISVITVLPVGQSCNTAPMLISLLLSTRKLLSVFSLDSRAYPGSRQRTCQACFSGGLRDVAQRLRLESGWSSARCLVVVVLRRMVLCTAPSTRRGRMTLMML